MAQQRTPGREQRDAILAALEQYRLEHDVWPTGAEIQRILNMSKEGLRHHANAMIRDGLIQRNAGGVLQVLRHDGERTLPEAMVSLDHLLLKAVAELQVRAGDAPISMTQILNYLAEQRRLLSSRATYLVNTGRLVRVGRGYRLPETNSEQE